MNRITARLPSKRVFPIQAVILLFLLVWTIQPELAASSPVLAIWTFENNGIAEADAREYIDTLIYHLEKKGLFRIVDAGDRVLSYVPEVSLFGAISKGNGSYGISIRLQDSHSAETIHVVPKIYASLGELFEDSRRLVDEIVVHYNTARKFLHTEEELHSYTFQGEVYYNEFSGYMDLLKTIEAQPDISAELQRAIETYRLRRLSYGLGVLIEGIGDFALIFGGIGLATITGATVDPDVGADAFGRGLLIFGGAAVVGVCIRFLGSKLSTPKKPTKVVAIYNRGIGE